MLHEVPGLSHESGPLHRGILLVGRALPQADFSDRGSPNAGAVGVRQMVGGDRARRASYSTTISLPDTDTVPRPKGQTFVSILNVVAESGDLGENLLGSANHLPVLDVVSGSVPQAEQSPVLDRSARQVCAPADLDVEPVVVDRLATTFDRAAHPVYRDEQ